MSWLVHQFSNSSNDVPRIRLMHHDARWKQEFEQTRSSILQSCEGRASRVEHVGSTAISGLIAQPIIDVIVVTDQDDVDTIAMAASSIEGLNFRETEPPAWCIGQRVLWFNKPRHGETTHRVMLVPPAHRLLAQTILIRDYLRTNPELAIDFEELKVRNWKECDGDVESYEKAKSLLFATIVR